VLGPCATSPLPRLAATVGASAAPAARTKDVLSARGADDDLCAHGRLADLHAAVAVLGQLTHEQLVELGVEDAIRDELRGCAERGGRSARAAERRAASSGTSLRARRRCCRAFVRRV
jgi:hypothetical protein